jgi:hypothetical protein
MQALRFNFFAAVASAKAAFLFSKTQKIDNDNPDSAVL